MGEEVLRHPEGSRCRDQRCLYGNDALSLEIFSRCYGVGRLFARAGPWKQRMGRALGWL